jgi:long-chain acyl-CoA synthetase
MAVNDITIETAQGPPSAYLPLNIAFSIRSAAARAPAKMAIRDGDRSLNYGELSDRIDRVTGAVAATIEGAPGDRILLLAPNCLEFMEIIAGVSQAGLALALPATRASAGEVKAIADDAKPKLIIVHTSLHHLVANLGCPIITIGDDYEAWIKNAAPATVSIFPDETATFAIPYTSGTTGKPKGVMLSTRSRILTAYAMAVEFECFGRDDRHLAIAPLYHGGGLAFALVTLLVGATLDVMSKFDPEAVLSYLSTETITSIFVVPTHLSAIFGVEPHVRERYRHTSLKTIISNAAALPTSLKERAIAYWGPGKVFECYGGTEAGILSALRPADQLRKTQCVGQVFPDVLLSLRDPDGSEVPDGEVGEIWSKSPYGFNGYLNLPEQTAMAINKGWVTVGDLGRRDEEGYLYVVGRKQDMVISGGVNIYPGEVETVLNLHADIMESAVVGRPDDHWGEVLTAFVVLRPGSTLDAASVIAFCRLHLSSIKSPRSVHFIPAVPKSPTGKVLKKDLRDLST